MNSKSPTTTLVVFGVPLAVYLVFAIASAWVCDDAYIAFRYSSNFADGLGLRFNVGTGSPVEGYTQLGWVLWIAGFEWLGLDPVLWSRVTGVLAGAILLGLVTRTGLRRLDLGAGAAMVVGLFFAVSPTVMLWATGGLGTMCFALAIFVTAERLLGDVDQPRLGHAATGAIAVALLRADGVYWLAMILLLALAFAVMGGRRKLLMGALICGAIVAVVEAAQMALRLVYYGDWMPNTVRAKVGFSWELLERGAYYLATHLLTFPAMAAVLLLALPLACRSGAHLVRVCVTLAAGTFAYGVLVGGDFMAMGRFFLPAVPFLALSAGCVVAWLNRRVGVVAATAFVGALGLGLVPARFDAHLAPRSWREAVLFRWSRDYETEYVYWVGMQERVSRWVELGKAMKSHTEPGESIVRTAIGAIGYHSDLFIYDTAGLVNREVAMLTDPTVYAAGRPRVGGARGLGSPGHDRCVKHEFFEHYEPTYKFACLRFDDDPGETEPAWLTRRLAYGNPPLTFSLLASDGYRSDGFLVVLPFAGARGK